ncbi:HTH-type transcriptional repressor AseR [bacterium HR17]|jgi:ArsR family transcriptional regulator|uniref:HTH-type transcriptional repressor AseR n=1 Tax=Candidatus Fervidibacter japonicus TaxID=2035412 RepID=A0A2H5XES0_9BACT|nr:HTH-type transcriptional repressor AseR [bacterium HR17]
MATVKEIVKVLKALADETRLRVLKVLMQSEFCVCELVDALEVNQSNLSRHLAVLKNAGLVSDRKEGLWVYYTVAKDAKPLVKKLLTTFGNLDTPRTRLDWERLQQRLQMRVDGKCPLGSGKLPPSRRKER